MEVEKSLWRFSHYRFPAFALEAVSFSYEWTYFWLDENNNTLAHGNIYRIFVRHDGSWWRDYYGSGYGAACRIQPAHSTGNFPPCNDSCRRGWSFYTLEA